MVDYRALQDFFNQGDVVTGIDVRVDDVFAVAAIGAIAENFPRGAFASSTGASSTTTSLRASGCSGWCSPSLLLHRPRGELQHRLHADHDRARQAKGHRDPQVDGRLAVRDHEGVRDPGPDDRRDRHDQRSDRRLGVCLLIKYTDFGLDPSIYMIDHLPVQIDPPSFWLWESWRCSSLCWPRSAPPGGRRVQPRRRPALRLRRRSRSMRRAEHASPMAMACVWAFRALTNHAAAGWRSGVRIERQHGGSLFGGGRRRGRLGRAARRRARVG
jgi:hypothetical protein